MSAPAYRLRRLFAIIPHGETPSTEYEFEARCWAKSCSPSMTQVILTAGRNRNRQKEQNRMIETLEPRGNARRHNTRRPVMCDDR